MDFSNGIGKNQEFKEENTKRKSFHHQLLWLLEVCSQCYKPWAEEQLPTRRHDWSRLKNCFCFAGGLSPVLRILNVCTLGLDCGKFMICPFHFEEWAYYRVMGQPVNFWNASRLSLWNLQNWSLGLVSCSSQGLRETERICTKMGQKAACFMGEDPIVVAVDHLLGM